MTVMRIGNATQADSSIPDSGALPFKQRFKTGAHQRTEDSLEPWVIREQYLELVLNAAKPDRIRCNPPCDIAGRAVPQIKQVINGMSVFVIDDVPAPGAVGGEFLKEPIAESRSRG